MEYIPQIAFVLVLGVASFFFTKSIGRIRRNIGLGREKKINDRKGERWKKMFKVAIGQSKMVRRRTLAGIMHVLVYVGFLVINIEVIEIVIDGLTGAHRILAPVLGPAYNVMTVGAEVFLLLVFVGTVVFLFRRNVTSVPRLAHPDLKGWPKLDGNIILWTEIVLIVALFVMNASDQALQKLGAEHYDKVGVFPLSSWAVGLFDGLSEGTLIVIERTAWWAHIIGILAFLNYIPYSKHLHIFLSFPNVWYSQLDEKGHFPVNETIKKEVESMMNPDAPQEEVDPNAPMPTFGAKDVQNLTWKNLLDAYTCTECGRCTSACPANITGKKLSPRWIMMMTRDRLHDVGENLDKDGNPQDDGKTLHDYITAEELWACTTCNACHDACPVNINPMDIIVQMRQYLVMEQSGAPEALNAMFMNVENNQAPWAFPSADRFKWAEGMEANPNGNGQATQEKNEEEANA